MFENVNYTYYSSTLGRSVIPSSVEFEKYTLEAKAYMLPLLPFLGEREENGIDKTVCMLVEVCYSAKQSGTDDGRREASRTIGSFSQSFDTGYAKSTDVKKSFWINQFCYRKTLC